MSKNVRIQCVFSECELHKLKNISHTWWNKQVRENITSILERDKSLRSLKKCEKMYHWDWFFRARVVNNTIYQFVGSNLEDWGFFVHFVLGFQENRMYTIHLCFSWDITKRCKVYTKLTPGLKMHMKTLNNFRQTMESPKSWNSMSLLWSKKLIPSAKTLYTEDSSNNVFNFLCENSPNFSCHFWNHKSFFTSQLLCISFSSNITYFLQK